MDASQSGYQCLPRVLILNGEPASAASGSGITLQCLFQGWPREQLAQVYTAATPHTLTVAIDYHVSANARRNLRWLNMRSKSAQLLGNEADRTKSATFGRGRADRLRIAAKQ